MELLIIILVLLLVAVVAGQLYTLNITVNLRAVGTTTAITGWTSEGIDDSRIDEMAHHIAVNEGLEHAYAPLTEQDIKEILMASL